MAKVYSEPRNELVNAANGVDYAYRDTGGAEGEVPLVLLQHLCGCVTLDVNAALSRRRHGMTYLGSGDPARRRTDYYPSWLDSLADDVTMEGSVLDGFVQDAEAVRTVLGYARTLYEYQEFNFAGPYGENGFLEDYTARVGGEPIGSVVLVARNAAGQVQHIVANHRPRSSLLLFSRLMGERFAGTPYGEHFATSES